MRRTIGILLLAATGCGGVAEESESPIDAGAETAADTAVAPIDSNPAADSSMVVDDTATAPDVSTETKPGTCITDPSPGTHTFTCAGIGYTVTIPPSCPSVGCGLILDVHGATMDAAMEEANTQLRVAAPKLGFVVIQPTAPGKVPSTSWTPGTDDVKVHAVLVEAIDVLGIDKSRVHMTGFSQGGMMTSRFLCRWGDLFASVAPAAGTGCSFIGLDAPSREVPMLYMHGTADVLVAFAQGAAQRDAAIAAWKMTGGTTVASDGKYSWKRWTSPKGTVLEFIQHDYKASSLALQGHCYPGSTDKGAEPGQLFPFACIPPSAFVWGDEVLKFFVAHPRP